MKRMKRIAVVTGGMLPVPDVQGGAVESLITVLLEDNEDEALYMQDVYTISSEELKKYSYKYTNIIQIYIRKCDILKNKIRYWLSILSGGKLKIEQKDLYLENVCKQIIARQHEYDYILIENSAEIYKKVYENIKDKNHLIFHMHGCNYNTELIKLIGNTAWKVVVISNSVEKYVRKICSQANTAILYNCVNKTCFDYSKKLELKEAERKKYGITGEQVVILFTGRLVEDKGVVVLYEAFMQIKDKYPNTILVFAGTAGYGNHVCKSGIEERVERENMGNNGRIIFTGYVEQKKLANIYAMADIMVVPSLLEEPFGVVTIEAMAMGLPIVATRSGGIPEIVNEDCAILVDKNEDLLLNIVKALERLCTSKDLREVMGDNALKRLNSVKEFDSRNYLQFFSKILENDNEW